LEQRLTADKPLVIGVTEVKPKNLKTPLTTADITMEGYDAHLSNDHSGRMVCIYTAKEMRTSECDFNKDISFQECIFVKLHPNEKDTILVGCIYRSPSTDEENNSKLVKLMREIDKTSASHILIMGDFNLPEIDWINETSQAGPFHRATTFLESSRDSFLYQHIKEPTRFRINQEPSILDLVFTFEENMVSEIEVQAPLGHSDHGVIVFTFHCCTELTWMESRPFKYDKGDYEKMCQEMSIDWNTRLRNTDAQASWNNLQNMLKESATRCIPTTRSGGARKTKPIWMNGRSLDKIRDKKNAWRTYKTTRQESDQRIYAKARNQARWATRNAVKSFEHLLALEIKQNPKSFWKYVGSKTKTRS
jgi:endonuclease/exonuclease/phosphatase family metal-dependent hydrolase